MAQRSITLRQVLTPIDVDSGVGTFRLHPGVLLTTMLSLHNTSAAPGLDRFDPDHYQGRRLSPRCRCPPGSWSARSATACTAARRRGSPSRPSGWPPGACSTSTTSPPGSRGPPPVGGRSAGWPDRPGPVRSPIAGADRSRPPAFGLTEDGGPSIIPTNPVVFIEIGPCPCPPLLPRSSWWNRPSRGTARRHHRADARRPDRRGARRSPDRQPAGIRLPLRHRPDRSPVRAPRAGGAGHHQHPRGLSVVGGDRQQRIPPLRPRPSPWSPSPRP